MWAGIGHVLGFIRKRQFLIYPLNEYEELTIQGSDLPYLDSLKDLEELNVGYLNLEGSSKEALSGLSKKLRVITMRCYAFAEIKAFKKFSLEHVKIDNVNWDEGFRKISVLKSTLKSFTFTRIDFDDDEVPTMILSELNGFLHLRKVTLSSYNSQTLIEDPNSFENLRNSSIEKLKLCGVKTSA